MAIVQLLIKQRKGRLNEYMTGHFDWLHTFPIHKDMVSHSMRSTRIVFPYYTLCTNALFLASQILLFFSPFLNQWSFMFLFRIFCIVRLAHVELKGSCLGSGYVIYMCIARFHCLQTPFFTATLLGKLLYMIHCWIVACSVACHSLALSVQLGDQMRPVYHAKH